ncbi:MAG: hypothetical protein WCR46_01555 [Deltaproteobacteria bacterium]
MNQTIDAIFDGEVFCPFIPSIIKNNSMANDGRCVFEGDISR